MEVVKCSLAMAIPYLQRKVNPSASSMTAMAWSYKGQFLAVEGHLAEVSLWTTGQGMWQPRQNLNLENRSSEERFTSILAWSPVSNCLATNAKYDSETFQIWCQDEALAENPLKLQLDLAEDTRLLGLDWSADGSRLAVVTNRPALQLWSIGASASRDSVLNLAELTGKSVRVLGVAWSINQHLAVILRSGGTLLDEPCSQALILKVKGSTCEREDVEDVCQQARLAALAWSVDGNLATAEYIFWRGRQAWVPVKSPPMTDVQGVAWAPDGAFLAKFRVHQLAVWALRGDFSLQLVVQAQGAKVNFHALAWSSIRGGGKLSVAVSVPTTVTKYGKGSHAVSSRGEANQLMLLRSETFESLPSQLGFEDSDICSCKHVTCKQGPAGRVDLLMKLHAGSVFWPLLPRSLAMLPKGPSFFALVGLHLDFTRIANESLPSMTQICEVLGLLPHLRTVYLHGSPDDVWDCTSGLSLRLQEFGMVNSRVSMTRRSLQVLLDLPELQSLDFSGTPLEVLQGKPHAALEHIGLRGSKVEEIELSTEHLRDSWLGRILGNWSCLHQVKWFPAPSYFNITPLTLEKSANMYSDMCT